jgi:hypothetical protein
MASDVGIAIVSSLSSGGFALLGVTLSDRRARRREREAFSQETALELAGMERHIWGGEWVELHAHVQRQEARMTAASVPEDLIVAFAAITEACWRDHLRSVELSDGEFPGIATKLLDARRSVHRAIGASLLKQRRRRTLAREAEETVQAALDTSERRRSA